MQTGIHPKWVAGTAGGEYHSECPECGGTDRFYIQPNKQMRYCKGYFCCRQCGIAGDTIKLATKFLNLTFQQAIQEVGVVIPNSQRFSQSFTGSYSFKPTILYKPKIQWINQATEFVERAHKQLLDNNEILNYLHNRGIPFNIITKYKLGWTASYQFIDRSSWGLTEEYNQNGNMKKLFIPRGIVIPSIDKSGEIMRLKIRRSDWTKNDKLPKYMIISGSMNGLNILEGSKDNLIIVESELDAYLLNAISSDSATIVSVGGNIKNPDNVVDRLAKNANKLLINHDNDSGGKAMITKWRKLYSHAIPCPTPIGKDIGEAFALGFDVESWLMEMLKIRIINAQHKHQIIR